MALIVKVGRDEDIPKDAVRLTQDQALHYQMNLIRDWPKLSEVFTLRMGPGLLGGAATISSLIINNHFRYKLKLGAYGRMSSYLSVVATPVLISALFHATFIQSYVVLRAYDCPLCLQTKAAMFQAGSAVAYPFILAPVAAFMFATRHFTFRLPSIISQPKEVAKIWLKLAKSGKTMGLSLLAFNMLVAMLVTGREMTEHYKINLELAEFEKKVDSGSLEDSEL